MKVNADELGQQSLVFEFKMFRFNIDIDIFPVTGTSQKFCGVHQ
jgi:hypothetical protein